MQRFKWRETLVSPKATAVFRVALNLFVVACAVSFFFYTADYVLDDIHSVRFQGAYENWSIPYPRGGDSLVRWYILSVCVISHA
jgi:hypothetical protein